MLTPSRRVVIVLAVAAVICLALGLATDVGLFGWSLTVLIALYLCAAGVTRMARPRPLGTEPPR
jgi:hypothetical protein